MILKKRIDSASMFIPIKKCREIFREFISSKISHSISNLVLITNQQCNLKCRNCANFSPYLGELLHFYKSKYIINDLKLITKRFELSNLQIQGGEFFLHPDYFSILKYVIKNRKIHKVMIATNGLIIPEKKVLIAIKNSKKVYIRISNYGKINDALASRLKDTIERMRIPYYMHKFALGDSMWSYCGDKDIKRLSEEEMMYSYNTCVFAKNCLTLEDGFVSICSRATVAHIIQNFKISEKDGIDIRNKFDVGKFIKFAKERPPVEACYYCYGTSGKNIIPAEQMNKEELKEVVKFVQTRPDQTRPDQTRPDQTRPDQTRPDL